MTAHPTPPAPSNGSSCYFNLRLQYKVDIISTIRSIAIVSITLRGIPEKAFAYRLGNRSALDWIVDQYRVKTDKRSGITHDPNGYSDDPQYILKLIERVITVSLRTVDIVEDLAKLPFRDDSAS